MYKRRISLYLILLAFVCSCKEAPSEQDIAKKILKEYLCPQTAKLTSMEIKKTSPATSSFGIKRYEYIVSGEVEWPSGCSEFGATLPAGYKEKFDNKKVVLIKGQGGWQ